MFVPGVSLLGLKRIRGFVSILRSINPTIIIVNIIIISDAHIICTICCNMCLSKSALLLLLLLLHKNEAQTKFLVPSYDGEQYLDFCWFSYIFHGTEKHNYE